MGCLFPIDFVSVSASFFYCIQRLVCLVEDFVVGQSGAVYQGYADAGGKRGLLHRIQLVGSVEEPLGQGRYGRFGDVPEVQNELVPAEAAHDVPMAGEADEGVGEVLQDVISILVALGVIGFFEMVQVCDDEGIGDRLVRLQQAEVLFHEGFHGSLVQHAGESICFCLFLVGITGFLGFTELLQGFSQFMVGLGECLSLAYYLPVVMDGKDQSGEEQQ